MRRRTDRLGQEHSIIRIVNLHYEGTVETDVAIASVYLSRWLDTYSLFWRKYRAPLPTRYLRGAAMSSR